MTRKLTLACLYAGELFFIGYQIHGGTRLWYSGLDSKGDLAFDQHILLPHPVMHHDFAVTQDYALIIDHCLEMNGKVRSCIGQLIRCCACIDGPSCKL